MPTITAVRREVAAVVAEPLERRLRRLFALGQLMTAHIANDQVEPAVRAKSIARVEKMRDELIAALLREFAPTELSFKREVVAS